MKWIKNRALLHGIALWIPLVITSTATCAQGNTAPSAHGTSIPQRMSDSDSAAGVDLLQSAQQVTTNKSGNNAQRYAWVPMLLGDMLYHLKDSR